MTKRLMLLAAAGALLLAFTPHGNIPGKAELEVDGGTIEIDYVAPELKGRDLLANLKRPGANPWRLGADRPTTLSTPVDLAFGEDTLGSGRYTLRVYWDDEDRWWLRAYDSGQSVAATLPLEKSTSDQSEEHLVISLDGSAGNASIRIQWGTHVLDGTFSAAG